MTLLYIFSQNIITRGLSCSTIILILFKKVLLFFRHAAKFLSVLMNKTSTRVRKPEMASLGIGYRSLNIKTGSSGASELDKFNLLGGQSNLLKLIF